jgi:hypothetical protein
MSDKEFIKRQMRCSSKLLHYGDYRGFKLLILEQHDKCGNKVVAKCYQYEVEETYFKCYIRIPKDSPFYGRKTYENHVIFGGLSLSNYFKQWKPNDVCGFFLTDSDEFVIEFMTEKYYGINKECEDYIDIICNFKTERNDMKSLANTEKFPKGIGVAVNKEMRVWYY